MTIQLNWALLGNFSSSVGRTVALPAIDLRDPAGIWHFLTSVSLFGLWSLEVAGCLSWLTSTPSCEWLPDLCPRRFVLSHGCLCSWNPFTIPQVTEFQWQLFRPQIPKNLPEGSITHIVPTTSSAGCGSAPRYLLVTHQHLSSSLNSFSCGLDGRWKKEVISF